MIILLLTTAGHRIDLIGLSVGYLPTLFTKHLPLICAAPPIQP